MKSHKDFFAVFYKNSKSKNFSLFVIYIRVSYYKREAYNLIFFYVEKTLSKRK